MTAVPGPPRVLASLSPFAFKLRSRNNPPIADPRAILALEGRALVTVPGVNAVLEVKDGVVSKFPISGRPKSFFPTALALGPDGNVYVGEATYYAHKATIWKVPPTGGKAVRAFSGFTDISGIAFGPSGDLFVTDRRRRSLSDDADPFSIDQRSGRVLRVRADGSREILSPKTFLEPIGAAADATGVFVSVNTDQLAKEPKASAKEMRSLLQGLRGRKRAETRKYLRASEVGGRIVHLTP